MKSPKPLLLSAALAVLSLGSASAQVLFNDTTGFTNWYKGGSTTGTLTKGVNTLDWNTSGTAGLD